MKKQISCGIILEDINYNILIVRPTNSYYYQIPKGLYDINDVTYWDTAKREFLEETNVNIDHLDIIMSKTPGRYKYLKHKDLYLFKLTVDELPDIKSMFCKSHFFNTEKGISEPEVDDYQVIPYKDYPRWLNKNLVKVFDKIG